MGAHEPERSSPSAGATLFAYRAVDLFMPRVVAQTLTAPHRNVFLLLQRLFYRTTLPRHFDLQSLEECNATAGVIVRRAFESEFFVE